MIRASGRRLWIAEHPEVTRRLGHLDTELHVINRALGVERDAIDGIESVVERPLRSVTDVHLDGIQPSPDTPTRQPIEPDIGLGL